MGKTVEGDGEALRRQSVFRYVVLRSAVILVLVLALGGASTLAVYDQMVEDETFAEHQLPVFRTAARLSGNAAILTSLSSRQLAVDTAAELATLSDRIDDRAAMMAADLEQLAALGLQGETLARLHDGHAALVRSVQDLGVVLRQIAVLRRGAATAEELPPPLLRQRTLLLQRQEVVASEMATLVAALAFQAEAQVQASREHAAERTRLMVLLLSLATLAALFILVGLYRSLRRRVLDRLQALSDALADWRAGGRPAMAIGGPADEISDLAATLSELVVAVDRRTAELVAQATTDPLTGLYNRRGFYERAAEALARAARYEAPLSVVVGDIDHFKRINDSYGHATGDRVLRETALLWRSQLRDVDVSGRLGGEEFAALLPHTGEEAAGLVAERIRTAIGGMRITADDGRIVACTISLGVTTMRPGDGMDALMARADLALYDAKSRGRDCVVCAPQARVA